MVGARATADDLEYRVVMAVSEERNVDPVRIDEQLYDVIDIESLERIIQRTETGGSVELSLSFQFSGCHVTVAEDGDVDAQVAG